MDWRDHGFILNVKSFGETSAIIEVFTPKHGRHAGVVRGGGSRKMMPVLQPGAQVSVEWRARLEDHLGAFRVEPIRSRMAKVLADRQALAGLNSICGLLGFSLPDREPHPRIYDLSEALLDILGHKENWPEMYLQWEIAVLRGLGFGLDLGSCATTGATEGLCYVSPKSGRAVSAEGAGQWAERLLPLPPVMLGNPAADTSEVLTGLQTTGYFMEHWLAHSLGNRPLPAARGRLVAALSRNWRG